MHLFSTKPVTRRDTLTTQAGDIKVSFDTLQPVDRVYNISIMLERRKV
jgi:hypothetical protein